MPRLHPVIVYTAQRVALLAVVAALFWFTGLRGLPLLALALLVSGLVSIVLLRRSRGEVSARLVERQNSDRPVGGLRGLSRRIDQGARSEDVD